MKKFFISVKKEMAKVRWPNKKEMLTYSVATLSFVFLFTWYFAGLEALIAFLKTLVR